MTSITTTKIIAYQLKDGDKVVQTLWKHLSPSLTYAQFRQHAQASMRLLGCNRVKAIRKSSHVRGHTLSTQTPFAEITLFAPVHAHP